MRICFLLIALFLVTATNAQLKETVELLPGVTTLEGVSNEVYLYPEFTPGVIDFKNGKKGRGLLNYCVMTNEMQFINGQGDTLALSNEGEISLVSVGKDSFYYDGAHFLKQLHNYGWIKTAQYKTIKEIGRKKMGGYGETITGVAQSLNSFSVRKLFVELGSAERIVLSKETRFYVGNAKNEFLPLSQNSLLQFIPSEKQKAAKKYLKEHTVNFNDPLEIDKMLLAFHN